MERENIDLHYIKMAYLISERATCTRRKVGAVIVRNGIVLSTGYNGAPNKIDHCSNETCIRRKLNIPSGERHEMCRGSHAEVNAIAQAARNGVNIDNSIMYCTTQPCVYCAKAMVNAGIKTLIYSEDYGNGLDDLTKEMLKNIEIKVLKPQ